jgi:hypothetical protein
MVRPNPNALSSKKLLLTKWTAVTPRGKEKHFLVVKLVDPEPPGFPDGNMATAPKSGSPR